MAAKPAAPSRGQGILTTDRGLVIQVWDSWLARVTGIASEVACGQPITAVIPDLEARGLLARLNRVLEQGVVEVLAPAFHRYFVPCPPEHPTPGADLMRQRATIAPLRDGDLISGLLVTIEDVTVRAEPPEVAGLPAELGDDDWRVRRAGVEQLVQQDGQQAVAALLHSIRANHQDLGVLNSALQVLAMTSVDVVDALVELLGDPDPAVRTYSILALSDQPGPATVATLIDALDDPDANVRFHAIDALGKLRAAAAVDPLLAIARSGDFFLAFPALDALRAIGGGQFVPAVAALLADPLLQVPAAELIGHTGGPEAVGPLVGALAGDGLDAAGAVAVARALHELHRRQQDTFNDGALIADLTRQAWPEGATAGLLNALAAAGPADLPALVAVLGWLDTQAVEAALLGLIGVAEVQGAVVEALVRSGVRVVEPLLALLADPENSIRAAAALALGRIGSAQAVPALIEQLRGDADVAAPAAAALAQIGDQRAFPALLAALSAPAAALRYAAIAAINSLGHPETAAFAGPLLADPDPLVREAATRIVGYFGFPACLEGLFATLADPDERVRIAAVEHIPYLDDPRVAPAIGAALADPAPRVRAAAARGAEHLEPEAMLAPLLGALADPDAWVRYFAARSLGNAGVAAALAPLQRLVRQDPAFQVRIAALQALGQIGGDEAAATLLEFAAAEDVELARGAMRGLGRARPASGLPVILAALRAADAELRIEAAQALAGYAGADVEAALQWTAAVDGDERVVLAATAALAALRTPGAIQALIELLIDQSRRAAAQAALASLDDRHVPSIAAGLSHPEPAVRCASLAVLAQRTHPTAAALLPAALDDPAPTVRLAAVSALAGRSGPDIRRRLAALAAADPDAAVRHAASAALR